MRSPCGSARPLDFMSTNDDDLTAKVARLEAELAAARAERLMSTTILETAPVIVLRVSLDFTIEFISRVLPEYSGAPLVGQSVFAFAEVDQHSTMRKALEAARDTRLPTSYETVALAPDGTRDWYVTTVGPILDGDALIGLTLICTNVSRVRRAEAELKDSHARLEVALDAGRVGLWRWDAMADEVEWDARLCAMFGLDPAQGPKRRADWMALVPADQQERMSQHIDEALRSGNYPDYELAVGTPPDRRWFIVRGGPRRAADGRVTGLMGGVLEVTGLRVLEEQVRQTQKLEALGQLSAGIAHNFNNMLAAIVPVLELAKQRVEADVDLFEQALQSASRAADLVKDLMFFSRRSADPHRVQEPLETVVRRATELCVRTFGQLVHVELGDLRAASEVLVDGARTEQALVNLLVNARDAVEKLESPRRTVVVSANALPEAAARAAHDDAQGEYVELRVADRGAGMDEATRQRIFEPFFTTKPVGRGTGLGLPTAWAAAKAQGGYLTCESSPSVGTTFVLTLPSRRCGAADLHESTPPAAGAVVRVLVIDDEPFVLRSTIALLEHLGYRAFGASSGEEGVRMAKAEPADVVVLDRSMPGQPASATLAELRSLYPGLPIIAFSGLAEDFEGATVQLTKPATLDQLSRAIQQALEARPSRPEGG